jgi:hypothetical protein
MPLSGIWSIRRHHADVAFFDVGRICYNNPRGAPIAATSIMKLDLQDIALRTLILVAGGLAALVLSLKGQGQTLPALAVGGTLGAFMMARFGPTQH